MSQKAYGQITIVDITDIGVLAVVPESNLSTQQVYNPNIAPTSSTDDNNRYSPNWVSTNLVLTPVTTYAGALMEEVAKKYASSSYVKPTYTWTANGVEIVNASILGPTYKDTYSFNADTGVLTVRKNLLSETQPTLKYVCTVNWTEPYTSTPLTASGEMSFSWTRTGDVNYAIKIVAPLAVKYDPKANNNQGAFIEGVSIDAVCTNTVQNSWYYKQGTSDTKKSLEGKSAPFTLTEAQLKNMFEASSSITLGVNAVRATGESTDKNIVATDEITIFKISDGAAGDTIVTFTLTNPSQVVPGVGVLSTDTDEAGNRVYKFTGANLALAYTGFNLLEGGKDVSEYFTVKAIPEHPDFPHVAIVGGIRGETTTDSNEHEIQSKQEYRVAGICSKKDQSPYIYEQVRVLFKATATAEGRNKGYSDMTQYFTVSLLAVGMDGVSPDFYTIESSTGEALVRHETGALSPVTTVFNCFKQSAAKLENGTYKYNTTPYSVDWQLEYIEEGTRVMFYDGPNNQSTMTVNWNEYASSLKGKKECVAVAYAHGTNTIIAELPIIIVDDGPTGPKGDQGDAGLSFIFPNQSDEVHCRANGSVVANTIVELPFTVYQGLKAQTGYRLISAHTSPSDNVGAGIVKVSNGSISEGSPALKYSDITINSTSSFKFGVLEDHDWGGKDKIVLELKVQKLEGSTWGDLANAPKFYFSLIKRKQGEASLTLVLDTPNGGVMRNGETKEEIRAVFYAGDNKLPFVLENGNFTDPTTMDGTKAYISWYVYDSTGNGSYKIIDFSDTSKYTHILSDNNECSSVKIAAGAVHAMASFKCLVRYKTSSTTVREVEKFQTIIDYTDPLQVQLISTVGSQIVNNQGEGVIYARIFRNGTEQDRMKTEIFAKAYDSEKHAGKDWYFINSNEKKVVLMHGNSEVSPDPYIYSYKYDFLDNNGQSYNGNNDDPADDVFKQTTGKAIYVSGSQINSKVVITVEVTKKEA